MINVFERWIAFFVFKVAVEDDFIIIINRNQCDVILIIHIKDGQNLTFQLGTIIKIQRNKHFLWIEDFIFIVYVIRITHFNCPLFFYIFLYRTLPHRILQV